MNRQRKYCMDGDMEEDDTKRIRPSSSQRNQRKNIASQVTDDEIQRLKKQIEIRQLKKKLEESNPSAPPDEHKELMTKLRKEKEVAQLRKEIKQVKKIEHNFVALPQSSMEFKSDNNLSRSDISAPQMGNWLSSGGHDGNLDKFVIIDDLADEEKAALFTGTRRVLFGRSLDKKANEIKKTRKRLFDLKKDIDWNDAAIADNKKDLKVYESYSALQEALTKSCYYDKQVQVSVTYMANSVGSSSGASHFDEQQSISTGTEYYLTAQSLITKGELIIDEDSVKYTKKFMDELDNLLNDKRTKMNEDDSKEMWNMEIRETPQTEWSNFIDKYGQYYISRCEIGGAAYTSKMEESEDVQTRKTTKDEFRQSFEATVNYGAVGVGVTSSAKHGNSRDESTHKTNKMSAMSLSCHGGHASLCSPNDFSKWEESVNKNYKLWDVIKVLEVRPFYHLLDQKRKRQVLKYQNSMAKSISVKEEKKLIEKSVHDFDGKVSMEVAINNDGNNTAIGFTLWVSDFFVSDRRDKDNASFYVPVNNQPSNIPILHFHPQPGINLYKIQYLRLEKQSKPGAGDGGYLAVHDSNQRDRRDATSIFVNTTKKESEASIWELSECGNGNYYVYCYGNVKSEWRQGKGYALSVHRSLRRDERGHHVHGDQAAILNSWRRALNLKSYYVHVRQKDDKLTEWKIKKWQGKK